MPVIETTDLSKRYRRIAVKGGVVDTIAVDHVDPPLFLAAGTRHYQLLSRITYFPFPYSRMFP